MIEKVFASKFEIYHQSDNGIYSGARLIIIPIDPSFQPDEDKQRDIVSFLVNLYPNCEIISVAQEYIEFVDPGENLEKIICNLCGRQLEMAFWQSNMDRAYQNHFLDLIFETKCCNNSTSLNDLNYYFNAGFAKYKLIIVAPDLDSDLVADLLVQLENTIEVKLQSIFAKY